MRRMGHVAHNGGLEGCIQGFGGERDHLRDPSTDGRIILRWIVRK